VDFVVARGPALHRTAVLLTRQEQAAEDLVQIALAKAWQSWARIDGNHEAYVRAIMVNEFASAWRRRWRGEADAAAYPDVDALVAGARRRVAATRRRRLAVLGAVTAAVVVVGGLAITRPTHQSLPRPAVPPTAGLGPFTVSTGGDGFPEYAQGMKLLTVLDAPMLEQMNGSISVPTTAGRRLAVQMTCTPTDSVDRVAEWSNRMYADFTIAGSRGDNPACTSFPDQGYAVMGIATSAKTTVLADVMINHKSLPAPGLLFKDAKIHVAI